MCTHPRSPTLAALVLALGTAPACPAPPTAAEILSRVNSTYLKCRSYQDTGEVVTRFSGAGSHVTRRPFKTWFMRPALLRFEFSETQGVAPGHTSRYVVWP